MLLPRFNQELPPTRLLRRRFDESRKIETTGDIGETSRRQKNSFAQTSEGTCIQYLLRFAPSTNRILLPGAPPFLNRTIIEGGPSFRAFGFCERVGFRKNREIG